MWYRIYSCSPFYAMLVSILGNRATSMSEWKTRRKTTHENMVNTKERKKKTSPRTNISLHLLCSFVFQRNESKARSPTPHQLCHVMFFMLLLSLHFSSFSEAEAKVEKALRNLRSSLDDRFGCE